MSPTRISSRRAPSSAIARTSTPSAWGRSSTSNSGAQGVPRRRDDATRSAPAHGAGLRGRRGARGRAASPLGGQGPERGGASQENREGRDRRGSRGARRLLRRPGEGRGGEVRQRHGEDRLADALPLARLVLPEARRGVRRHGEAARRARSRAPQEEVDRQPAGRGATVPRDRAPVSSAYQR